MRRSCRRCSARQYGSSGRCKKISQWSSVSPAWFADVKVGLDADGNIVAFRSDWYSPHENDVRMLGADPGGDCRTITPRASFPILGRLQTVWPYDQGCQVCFEQAFFCENLAMETASGGLRGNIMRTPWQRQQNTALEGIITEAAAAAGADPSRVSGFGTQRMRPSSESSRSTGRGRRLAVAFLHQTQAPAEPERSRSPGEALGLVIRSGSPWVAVVEVEVVPATGRRYA